MKRLRTVRTATVIALSAGASFGLLVACSGDGADPNLPPPYAGDVNFNQPGNDGSQSDTEQPGGTDTGSNNDGSQNPGDSTGAQPSDEGNNPTQNGQADNTQSGNNSGAGGSANTSSDPNSMAPMGGSSMASNAGSGMVAMGGSASMNPGTPQGDGGCDENAIFCEDFDGRPMGALQAGTNNVRPERNVSIINDPEQGQVLQVVAGSTYDNRAGMFVDNFSAPNNSFYGKMLVRIQALPTQPDFAHWVLVEATGGGSSEQLRPIGGQFIPQHGTNFWGIGSDGGATGDWTAWDMPQGTGVVEPETGRWTCIEWRMQDATSTIEQSIDGVPYPDLTVNRTRHGFTGNTNAPLEFPDINTLWFGWVVFQGNTQPPQFDVRYDDIVISTTPIGCD